MIGEANVMASPKLTLVDAMTALSEAGNSSVRLLERPNFDVSVYRPEGLDLQGPHKRDELYVVASGSGEFTCDGWTEKFRSGDIFFVTAGAAHHFDNFSSDFSTWVIFFGPRPAS